MLIAAVLISLQSLATWRATAAVVTPLVAFGTGNGRAPYAGLVLDNDGNFYGTTSEGGPNAKGTVFQMTTNGRLTTLYSFTGGNDGAVPQAGLIPGADGSFYGTTSSGGAGGGVGTLFQVTSNGILTTLATFTGSNGAAPLGALVQAGDGNLYGTTSAGGINGGYGTVFVATTNGALTSLFSFDGANGSRPVAGLIQGNGGTFYGTTSGGGNFGSGTVFALQVATNAFTRYILSVGFSNSISLSAGAFATNNSFETNVVVGIIAVSNAVATENFGLTITGTNAGGVNELLIANTVVVTNAFGGSIVNVLTNVFNVAIGGAGLTNPTQFNTNFAANASGLAFSITNVATNGSGGVLTNFSSVRISTSPTNSASTNGTLTTLYTFTGGADGAGPQAGLVQGSNGLFYGTTAGGGTNQYGTVFQITPGGNLTTVALFNGTNGAQPFAALVPGQDGNFYGTASAGGASGSFGTVFRLGPKGPITNMYAFQGGNDGANPHAALAFGTDGNLYGTAIAGGAHAAGTVFRVSGLPPYIITQPASQSVPRGTAVQFVVAAGGSAPLKYQWRHSGTNLLNGVNIFGATSATLTISNATLANGGTNRVVVSNSSGSVTSSPVALSIVNPPTVAITSPANNARLLRTNIVVAGTAGDNVAVARVYYQVNGTGWNVAATTNAWSTWTGLATLGPGTNTVQAYAVNILGLESETNSVTAIELLRAPLVVDITGGGSVQPNYNGANLVIGNTYAMTALPNAGFIFSNWTGGVLSNSAVLTETPTLRFVMASNLVLQANFVTNLFYGVRGTYSGLFYDHTNGVAPASAGSFAITTTAAAAFSGNLLTCTGRYPLQGRFDAGGNATATVRRNATPLTVDLALALAPGVDQVTGTVSDGTFTAELLGNRAVFSAATNPAPEAGRYTMVLPGVPGQTNAPSGDSYGAILVGPAGVVQMHGSLADGTGISQMATLSKDGQWPFYLPLYGGKGLVLGWITFSNAPPVLSGSVTWIRPAIPAARYFQGGFSLQTNVFGSFYVPPGAGGQVLNLTNAELVLSGGTLAQSITNPISAGGGGSARLTFAPASGVFSGSVMNAGTPKPLLFKGVALQNLNVGRGYFLEAGQSGEAVLQSR